MKFKFGIKKSDTFLCVYFFEMVKIKDRLGIHRNSKAQFLLSFNFHPVFKFTIYLLITFL